VTQIYTEFYSIKPERVISLSGSRRIHKIIFNGFKINTSEDVEWTELAQDIFQSWVVIDAVMNFRVL
jgi:hypothetical protein